ncbi:hypothetical protein ACQZEU_12570, partial [Corynebacterium diphtheriae]
MKPQVHKVHRTGAPFIDGQNDGTEASIDKALLGKIDLIVTTTGNVNVCDANMLKALKKRAVVCNIGHFDNEIDTAFMRKNWAMGRSEATGAQGSPHRR